MWFGTHLFPLQSLSSFISLCLLFFPRSHASVSLFKPFSSLIFSALIFASLLPLDGIEIPCAPTAGPICSAVFIVPIFYGTAAGERGLSSTPSCCFCSCAGMMARPEWRLNIFWLRDLRSLRYSALCIIHWWMFEMFEAADMRCNTETKGSVMKKRPTVFCCTDCCSVRMQVGQFVWAVNGWPGG